MSDLQLAMRAAQAAAALHRAGGALEIEAKSSDIDLVTRVDREAEATIRAVILAERPDDAILGEEEGLAGLGPRTWVVDPLDGTLNYAHGFPYYCVSVALQVDGVTEVGVVLDSTRDELFAAVRGGGATLNGAPIRVSGEGVLRRSMIATGFAYRAEWMAENLVLFNALLPQARALRRPGAAALDLANLAAGRLDGFWELHLNPWDVAAGSLLVTEAGGQVSDEGGAGYRLGGKTIVASNGALHPELLAALAAAGA